MHCTLVLSPHQSLQNKNVDSFAQYVLDASSSIVYLCFALHAKIQKMLEVTFWIVWVIFQLKKCLKRILWQIQHTISQLQLLKLEKQSCKRAKKCKFSMNQKSDEAFCCDDEKLWFLDIQRNVEKIARLQDKMFHPKAGEFKPFSVNGFGIEKEFNCGRTKHISVKSLIQRHFQELSVGQMHAPKNSI